MRHLYASVMLYKAADAVHAVAQRHSAAGGVGIADDGIHRFGAKGVKGKIAACAGRLGGIAPVPVGLAE